MYQILGLIAFAIAVVGGIEWYGHNAVVKDRAVQEAKAAKLLNEQLQKMVDHGDDLSKQNAREKSERDARINTLEQRFAERAKNDPKLAAWLDAPVPDDVRRLRRLAFPGSPSVGLVLYPDKAADKDGGAADGRREEQKSAGGSNSAPSGADTVQQGQRTGDQGTAVPESVTESALKRIRQLRSKP